MKFIHLSDLHILPRPQKIRGIDGCARLESAVDSINKSFADAELCMVTGDLVDKGDAESYKLVRDILDHLKMPWHGLMGNHDKGGVAQISLDHLPWQSDGSLQYELSMYVGQFIVLDSSIDSDSGRLSGRRLNWLRERLEAAKAANKDVFIFMHHVPFDIKIPWLDRIKMENGEEMWEVVKNFNNVRHMFFGHVHRPIHGSWHGIPFSTVRTTAHQVALQFEDLPAAWVEETPSYAIVIINDEQVLIHDHNFMEEHLEIVE
jgi:3',5'-cyclic AMP phosphodiesterase CpdA